MDAGSSTELDARSIVTTRVIDAPRELVFEAWTSPEHLARWWGPNGFTTTTHAFDFRVGGEWSFTMHGPDGRDYENHVRYREIVRPERIAYEHGGDGGKVMFRSTITFEDLGGRTRLTMRGVFDTKAQRDLVAETYGAVEGAKQTLGRLADYVGEDTFEFTRTVHAPRTLVWKMWSEVEHLSKWWGPKGFPWIKGTLEFRPGGTFHYGMRSPNGDEMWGLFVYREIAEPERIVFVNSFSNPDGKIVKAPFFDVWPLEVLNVLTLRDEGNKTVVTLRGKPINATAEERAKYASMFPSMRGGFGGTFDQLEAYLVLQQAEGKI